MQSPADPLAKHAPNPVIERIFARLHLTYANRWTEMWLGLDAKAIAADWNHTLARFASPAGLDAIAWALDNLKGGWPPTSVEFRDLVLQAPRPEPKRALPAPDELASPERVREALAGLSVQPGKGGRSWFARLAAREAAGEKLTFHLRQLLREGVHNGFLADSPERQAEVAP